jgi:hypothetical protein
VLGLVLLVKMAVSRPQSFSRTLCAFRHAQDLNVDELLG